MFLYLFAELGDDTQINEVPFWEELPCGVYSTSICAQNKEQYLVGEIKNHGWTNPMLKELVEWERSNVEPVPEQLNVTHASIFSWQEGMQEACLVPGNSGNIKIVGAVPVS